MKTTETFGGAVREQLNANAIEFVGRLYSDKRSTGHRVKALTSTRLWGPTLYKLWKTLSEKFPSHVVKVERYGGEADAADSTNNGVVINFTQKAEV